MILLLAGAGVTVLLTYAAGEDDYQLAKMKVKCVDKFDEYDANQAHQ